MANPSFDERVRKAVEETDKLEGMRKSFRTILDRQSKNRQRAPDLDARKDRLRRTKEESVGNERLFSQAVSTLRENGVRVILAKTDEAAVRAVVEEVRGNDLVVKSKSNVTKEIHLAEGLEKEGVRVIETDLGDRIIQLAGCQAAHPTGPACHLTRKEIATLFSEHFGLRVSEDPNELTRVMRAEIATYLDEAKVGITGANAVTAQEGAIVIVHNEGNAARCSMVPEKHIVVTTPDKVVPSLDDAVNITKLQTFLSTGKVVSSYLNIISGVSYTSDIEKQVYRGMHGPKEVVVVIVDDGRLETADKEALYCIGCGMCLLQCPVYDIVGPVFGSTGRMGGQGVYLDGTLGRTELALESGLYLCTSCGACKEACPSKVDTKSGIIRVRNGARESKFASPKEHNVIVASIANYENPWMAPRKSKQRWAEGLGLKGKGETLYFAGCSTSLVHPETAKKVVRLMRAGGVEPAYLGSDERCCGSTLRKLGYDRLARERAEACFTDFSEAGAKLVVTSCPGCASALRHFKELQQKYGVQVEHVTEFLDRRLDETLLAKIEDPGPLTYHDPCDLGRDLGVYEAPRRLLRKVTKGDLREMERARENSSCCGSGSGVKSAYPELSKAIASKRVEMARQVGARTLVSACPWCVQSLRECQGVNEVVKVLDLVDLLDKALRGCG